jgi:hypothetical protein
MQPGQHPHAVRGLDFYPTPVVAVRALLEAEQLPHFLWDPCAGGGGIVRELRDAGHAVIASDIALRGFPLHFTGDFLAEAKAPAQCEAIISNPPYMCAEEIISHAIKLVPRVICLLRLAFIESERRSPILDTGKLAKILFSRSAYR